MRWIDRVSLLLLSLVVGNAENTTYHNRRNSSITYVIDPLDSNAHLDGGPLSIITEGAYIGRGALLATIPAAIEYRSHWSHTLPDTEKVSHICHQEGTLSFWYRTTSALNDTTAKLVLWDNSARLTCTTPNCTNETSLVPNYETPLIPLHSTSNTWTEVLVPAESLSTVLLQQESGENATATRNQDIIFRKWELVVERAKAKTANGTTELADVVLELDHLSCTLFSLPNTITTTVAFEMNRSVDVHKETGTTPLLHWNYSVVQTKLWGGFESIHHVAPGVAYYNLSDVGALEWWVNITHGASVPDRTQLRLLLLDGHACMLRNRTGSSTQECKRESQQEFYYSFWSVLDTEGEAQITLPLEGDDDPRSPFFFTGWAGISEDRIMDKSRIVGFRYDLSIDDRGQIGSAVDGELNIGRLKPMVAAEEVVNDDRDQCVVEPNLFVRSWGELVTKDRVQDCCAMCVDDPTCKYGVFWIGDTARCGLAVGLDEPSHSEFYLYNGRGSPEFFWMDTEAVRGKFCSKCRCIEESLTIDCRAKNLTSIPKTFNETWEPRVLDLRGNPSLAVLGSGSLSSIAKSLHELLLPESTQYIAPDVLKSAPSLSNVHLPSRWPERTMIINAVENPLEPFQNVCCERGEHFPLLSPPNGLTFCGELTPKLSIGSDAVYEYNRKFKPGYYSVFALTKSSSYLAEAAESPEMCAEYCQIISDCNYFQYDGRKSRAEAECLLINEGTNLTAEGSAIGYTVGYPARTRHDVDNASTYLSTDAIDVNDEDGFEFRYEIGIGSAPTRGFVRVTPKSADGKDYVVTFKPSTIALSRNLTSAVISGKIRFVNVQVPPKNIVVDHEILSCDRAFLESGSSMGTILINIVEVPKKSQITISMSITMIVVLFLTVGALLAHNRFVHEANDTWKLNQSDLHFYDPPRLLGQGNFGHVVLAKWRGTEVAVKRVLPPLESSNASRQFSHSQSVFGHGTKSDDSVSRACTNASKTKAAKYMKFEFLSEMRTVSKIRHPNIISIMGAVVDVKEPMLVMEYMFFGDVLLPIIRDIVQGGRFLHSSDPPLIHAKNILVDDRFRAKITDFGLATKRVVAGGYTGTPYWMAPELLRKQAGNSIKTDIYAFGIILFELFSREDPYKGEEYQQVIADIKDASKNKRPRVPNNCPAPIASLMIECISEVPSHRPNFAEVDERLKRFSAESVAPGDTQFTKKYRKAVRNEELLFQMFPHHVAEALRDGRSPVPDKKDMCAIFFSDIVSFTTMSASLSAGQVTDMLDRLYKRLDILADHHRVFKVDTIGDAFLGATNLVEDQPADFVKRMAKFSIDAVKAANETLIDPENSTLGSVSIRCGFHVGPVVGRVVGTRTPKYSVFGDTVNGASRMESHSLPGRIQCSKEAAELLQLQAPEIPIASRGVLNIKSKGNMETFFVNEQSRDLTPKTKSSSERVLLRGQTVATRNLGRGMSRRWLSASVRRLTSSRSFDAEETQEV